MVGADGSAFATDIFYIIAGADELCSTQGEQITKFGIGTMVNRPVCFHALQHAAFVGGKLDVHEKWRTLAGVGLLLEVVVAEKNRTTGGDCRSTDQSLHGGAEFIAESSTGVVLYKHHVFRIYAQAGGNHVEVEMDTD